VVSFQITVLKVLAGQPEGCLSLDDLKRAVAILISSGSDWTDRTKRLAARAPDLDIFSRLFVQRSDTGWQITDAGRAFLACIEAPAAVTVIDEQAPVAAAKLELPPSPSVRLVVLNRHAPRRRRRADRTRPAA
jgi:hypothetical protein